MYIFYVGVTDKCHKFDCYQHQWPAPAPLSLLCVRQNPLTTFKLEKNWSEIRIGCLHFTLILGIMRYLPIIIIIILKLRMVEAEEGRSLTGTPTWAVGTVITVMVALGFFFQASLEQFGKVLNHTFIHSSSLSFHFYVDI